MSSSAALPPPIVLPTSTSAHAVPSQCRTSARSSETAGSPEKPTTHTSVGEIAATPFRIPWSSPGSSACSQSVPSQCSTSGSSPNPLSNRPTAHTSFGSAASTARSSFTKLPGLGASTGDHFEPSHRWIATAVGASGSSPIPPTAHASEDVTAVTPRSVVGSSERLALRTTSHVGVHGGGGEVEALGEGSCGSASSVDPLVANTTADPIAKVATAATAALTSPRR